MARGKSSNYLQHFSIVTASAKLLEAFQSHQSPELLRRVTFRRFRAVTVAITITANVAVSVAVTTLSVVAAALSLSQSLSPSLSTSEDPT